MRILSETIFIQRKAALFSVWISHHLRQPLNPADNSDKDNEKSKNWQNQKIQRERKMVGGTGIEPVTLTMSR
jgi:hypothetical protein